jgi:signal peptidase complex subunit 2
MAKKKSKTVKPDPVVNAKEEDDDDIADDAATDDEEEEEEEMELLQVDVGDMLKVKQILDETVAGTILEQIDEDYQFDNFKLVLMAIACAFAMVAQFAPLPFPDSRIVVAVCCVSYFVLSGVLQLITTLIDQDCILVTLPLPEDGKKEDPNDIDIIGRTIVRKDPKDIKNNDLFIHGVRVRSQFPRYSEWYTAILEFEQKKDTPSVEQKWSVGQFFDKEGMFDEIGLQLEVEKLYRRLEDADYDSKGSEGKKKD